MAVLYNVLGLRRYTIAHIRHHTLTHTHPYTLMVGTTTATNEMMTTRFACELFYAFPKTKMQTTEKPHRNRSGSNFSNFRRVQLEKEKSVFSFSFLPLCAYKLTMTLTMRNKKKSKKNNE